MASLTSQPVQSLPTLPTQPFRLDVPLHNLLQKPPDPSPPLARVEHEPGTSLALPSPVFPQHPALMHELDAADISQHDTVLQPGKRHWPAAKKDFWVYLATNGRLLRPEVTDRLADAGIATVNFAVDTIKEKPGLPKAFEHVRKNFDYLVRRQYRYGYTVFFNTNICRTNIDDVKELATIALENGISITFHVNEAPMMEQEHFKHLTENDPYILPQPSPKVHELLDWLIDKQRQGWKMVDSIPRLQNMKGFMRGGGEHWGCRAGQNWLIIRTNGTLAPSFPISHPNYTSRPVATPNFAPQPLPQL